MEQQNSSKKAVANTYWLIPAFLAPSISEAKDPTVSGAKVHSNFYLVKFEKWRAPYIGSVETKSKKRRKIK